MTVLQRGPTIISKGGTKPNIVAPALRGNHSKATIDAVRIDPGATEGKKAR
jgi:hypothetical protein